MDTPETELATLPRYRSHKIVQAAKIECVKLVDGGPNGEDQDTIFLVGENTEARFASPGWLRRCTAWGDARINPRADVDWGYLVIYEDGYQSWSPTAAFEAGYTEIEE